MRSRRFSKGVYLLPNLFTTFNLFCGFYAIIKIIQSIATDLVQFSQAGAAILVAAIFDSLDGRIARLTKTTSLFGLEYDSLADLTSFCLAPALLLYTWGVYAFGELGWLVCFLYFGCGALRLARFNTQSTVKERPYFVGLPTPMAAGLITTLVMSHPEVNATEPEKAYLLFLAPCVALLMVSNIPYPSFKKIDFMKQHPFSVLILILLSMVILVAKPILTMLLIFSGYTALGVLEIFLSPAGRERLQEFLTGMPRQTHAGDSSSLPPSETL